MTCSSVSDGLKHLNSKRVLLTEDVVHEKKCISMAANQNHVYPFFSKTLLFQFLVENTILHNL